MENASLAIRRGSRQTTEPTPEPKVILGQQALNGWAVSQSQRPTQIRVGERIDLQHEQSATSIAWASLATEDAVLERVVQPHDRPCPRPLTSFDEWL